MYSKISMFLKSDVVLSSIKHKRWDKRGRRKILDQENDVLG